MYKTHVGEMTLAPSQKRWVKKSIREATQLRHRVTIALSFKEIGILRWNGERAERIERACVHACGYICVQVEPNEHAFLYAKQVD